MAGLQKVLKEYGYMSINGIMWIWDYVNDKPRIKSEMTKGEISASEKIRRQKFKSIPTK